MISGSPGPGTSPKPASLQIPFTLQPFGLGLGRSSGSANCLSLGSEEIASALRLSTDSLAFRRTSGGYLGVFCAILFCLKGRGMKQGLVGVKFSATASFGLEHSFLRCAGPDNCLPNSAVEGRHSPCAPKGFSLFWSFIFSNPPKRPKAHSQLTFGLPRGPA